MVSVFQYVPSMKPNQNMSDKKLNFMGSLSRVVTMLQEAKKDFDMLYEDSQVRLPIEDVSFIDDRIREIHNLIKDLKLTNNQFEAIASKQHER